jgi:hypothetical protein
MVRKSKQDAQLIKDTAAEETPLKLKPRRVARRSNRMTSDALAYTAALNFDFQAMALPDFDDIQVPASSGTSTSPARNAIHEDTACLLDQVFQRYYDETLIAVPSAVYQSMLSRFFTINDKEEHPTQFISSGLYEMDIVGSAAAVLQVISLTQSEIVEIAKTYKRLTDVTVLHLRTRSSSKTSNGGRDTYDGPQGWTSYDDLLTILAENTVDPHDVGGPGGIVNPNGHLYQILRKEFQTMRDKERQTVTNSLRSARIAVCTVSLIIAKATLLSFLELLLRLRVENEYNLIETSSGYCGRRLTSARGINYTGRCYVCPLGTHDSVQTTLGGWSSATLNRLGSNIATKQDMLCLYNMVRMRFQGITMATLLGQQSSLRFYDGADLLDVGSRLLKDLLDSSGVQCIRSAVWWDGTGDGDEEREGSDGEYSDAEGDDKEEEEEEDRVPSAEATQRNTSTDGAAAPARKRRRIRSSDSDDGACPARKRTAEPEAA